MQPWPSLRLLLVLCDEGGGRFSSAFYDKHTWLGSDHRPLLFDEQYNRKPAFDKVRAALAEATDADFNADGEIEGAEFFDCNGDLETIRR